MLPTTLETVLGELGIEHSETQLRCRAKNTNTLFLRGKSINVPALRARVWLILYEHFVDPPDRGAFNRHLEAH
jgi:hypothetical protein